MAQWILNGFFIVAAITLLGGCGSAPYEIGKSIDDYNKVKGEINLGDSEQQVLSLLEPTQENLKPKWKKDPDKYMDGDSTVEVYYFRSSRQADGLVTDDEFTPYIFRDGVLVGIGWAMLGGPKTQGQAQDNTYIYNPAPNTTTNSNQNSAYCADAIRRGRPQDCR